MNENKSLLVLLSLLFIIVACDKENNEINSISLDTGFTSSEILKVANENLSHFKSSMIQDNIYNYGFDSPSELDQIQIGTPYLEIGLNTDFEDDLEYDYFDKYIINSKSWLIPLSVDNDIKCFMTVYVLNDSLAYAGGGSSDFAERFKNCCEKYNIQTENKYIIRERIYGNCDFAMIETEDDFNVYPIGDSLTFFCKDAYKINSSFEDFFYTFK